MRLSRYNARFMVMRKLQRQSALVHYGVTAFGVIAGLLQFMVSLLRPRSALVAENLFLRKQLAFYQEREVEPRRLTDAARACFLLWSRLFNWREALVVVKPETLIGWHRKGFQLFGDGSPKVEGRAYRRTSVG